MRRRRALLILAGAAALPLAGRAGTPRVVLGAEATLRLDGPPALVREAEGAAWAEVERLEGLLSLHRPDSALARLNATGRLDRPDPDLVACLRLAGRLHAATGGLFDPTVQPLWRALAEGGDAEAARGLVGWERVRLAEEAVVLGRGQALTLNGIAQGFVTDRVADLLAARGLTHALIGIGEHRSLGGPFRIGIEDPARGFLGQVTLAGGAVATSSPGAMTLPDGSAHILGPRGERPVWSTVTVTAPRAGLADALSTALCLMEEGAARRAAGAFEGVTARVVSPAGDLWTL